MLPTLDRPGPGIERGARGSFRYAGGGVALTRFPGTVGRERGQPGVFNVRSNREMVEALKFCSTQPQHVMDGIIKVTADARSACPGEF